MVYDMALCLTVTSWSFVEMVGFTFLVHLCWIVGNTV